MLAFARRQILEPRNLSLNQTVHDVLNLLDKVIGKDIEIQTALAEDLSAVRADPTQIEQVLMNLCINSRDAMPKGGRITIETRNALFSEEDCRRAMGLQPGRFAELRVSDTGTGMDAATRERIFEPFFTTKGTGKGTGLGLATVYGIVKQHNGFIQVESEPGQGSTFRIFLPVNETPTAGEFRPPIFDDLPVRGGNGNDPARRRPRRHLRDGAIRSDGKGVSRSCWRTMARKPWKSLQPIATAFHWSCWM